MTGDPIPDDLAVAHIVDALGLRDHEHLSVGQQAPGGPFHGSRMAVRDLTRWQVPQDRNCWVGLCVIPAGAPGRGTASEVRRVPALWADLDRKPGGMPTWDSIEAVIDDMSAILGSRPTYSVMTGHGKQPVWAVGEGSTDVPGMTDALAGFGALVRTVARAHGGDADSVFDVARVLRLPGSVNWKDPQNPVKATLTQDVGAPITLAQLQDTLNAYSIGPTGATAHVATPSDSTGWAWGSTCKYVAGMIAGWGSDAPNARHQWVVSCCVRLTAAHRLGCVAQDDHSAAVQALQARADQLRARDGQRPGEVAEAMRYAVARVESMSEPDCQRQLGAHQHKRERTPHDWDEPWRSVPMGQRMARDWRDRWLSVEGLGWHRWDGRRWEPQQGNGRVLADATEWVEQVTAEAHADRNSSRNYLQGLLRYRETGQVATLVQQARLDLLADAPQLDQHAHLLNCANGVVNLRTGALGPHDPSLLITKMAAVPYLPNAVSADWDKALRALDTPEQDWLQVWLGQSATGDPTPSDSVVILKGGGENGKSTLLGTAQAALGDYAKTVSDRLLSRSPGDHTTELTDLLGLRMAVLEELPDGRTLCVPTLKRIVGTPQITARRIGENTITWRASHTLSITTNGTPIVAETDHGTWRRLTMLAFNKTYKGAASDRDLKPRLLAKGSTGQVAALAWLVKGAVTYYANGVPEPTDAMRAAAEEWRASADNLGEFIAQRLEDASPNHVILTSDFVGELNTHLQACGHRPWSDNTIGQRLESRGIHKVRVRAHNVTLTRPRHFMGADAGRNDRHVAYRGLRWL